MTIGERIKKRRQELGLSQIELAKKMGLSAKSTICKLETQGDNITTDRIARIAAALNCSESYLMGWDDNKTQENAAFQIKMLSDNEFMEYSKKIFYADRKTKENIYKYIDFLLSQ